MIQQELAIIQHQIDDTQKSLDIMNAFYRYSAMKTINILATVIGIFCFVFLQTILLVKAIVAHNNGLIKDIMIYSLLAGIIYAMVYIIIQITISQTEFSKHRMRKAIHHINKKTNHDDTKSRLDNIHDVKQLLDEIKLDGETGISANVASVSATSVSALKQMKNIVNDGNIITYGYIYDLKCQLEKDLKVLQEQMHHCIQCLR